MVDLYHPHQPYDYLKTFPDYLVEIYPQKASFAQFMRTSHRAISDIWYTQVAYRINGADSDVLAYKKEIMDGLLVSDHDIDGAGRRRSVTSYTDFTEFGLSRAGYKYYFKKYSFNKLYGDFKRNNPEFIRKYKLSKMGWFGRIFKYKIPKLWEKYSGTIIDALDHIVGVRY
jgi:hypothetical protein